MKSNCPCRRPPTIPCRNSCRRYYVSSRIIREIEEEDADGRLLRMVKIIAHTRIWVERVAARSITTFSAQR